MRGLEQIPWLYDAMCAVCERTGLGRWRRWLVEGARGRTLDLGTGTGRNLPLYRPDVRVIGLDPAWPSIMRARRRAPSVPLVRASAEALPFRDGVFDTVVSGLAFCSVGDPRRGLAEVRRVLRPGGALRMLEHVRSLRPWKAWLQDRYQPAWTWLAGGCHPNRETERTVEEAGFRIQPEGRRAKNDMRRFVARPAAMASGDPVLAEIVRRLADVLHPERIYLFGSRARGEAEVDSDYDLMVVVPRLTEPAYRLAQRAHSVLWGLGTAADILVWSREAFDGRLHLEASLPATVVREGRLLHAA